MKLPIDLPFKKLASRNPDLWKFFPKILLLMAPAGVLFVFYLISDPFKVIYKYANYYSGITAVSLDRDYVSTETYLQYRATRDYDAFIFGNSRSGFYQTKDWSKHIGSTNCFHFDAAGESLYGVWRKVIFLDQLGVSIRHVLLVLDTQILEQKGNNSGHLRIKHPMLSGQMPLVFQMAFVKVFFDPRFLCAYIDFRLSDKIKPYMTRNFLLEGRHIQYRLDSNEILYDEVEALAQTNPAAFYQSRCDEFYVRPTAPATSPATIFAEQERMLKQINEIFRRHSTDCRIVISPLYDQKILHPADLAKLGRIFGASNVCDYSGKNAITDTITNYYETSHYRPHVARQIMAEIYASSNTKKAEGKMSALSANPPR